MVWKADIIFVIWEKRDQAYKRDVYWEWMVYDDLGVSLKYSQSYSEDLI